MTPGFTEASAAGLPLPEACGDIVPAVSGNVRIDANDGAGISGMAVVAVNSGGAFGSTETDTADGGMKPGFVSEGLMGLSVIGTGSGRRLADED